MTQSLHIIVLLVMLLLGLRPLATRAQSVTRYVDPRIGSEGLGRVYIGPCMPFGMIKPSPDCTCHNNAGWAPMPQQVDGYAQTHVSGTGGGPKYGNILIQPYCTGSHIQHRTSEDIQLAYYRTRYRETGIQTEVTSARRTSIYRITFPQDSIQHLRLDAGFFLGENPVPHAREAQQFEDSHTQVTSSNEVCGHQTISGGWNNGGPYTVYYCLRTSRPFSASTWSEPQYQGGNKTGATLSFDYHEDSVLLVRIAISFVSEEQARQNMHEDIPHWDFDLTRQQCLLAWEEYLTRLPLPEEATLRDKRMYYTALYHTMLMPTDRRERPEDEPYYDDYYAIWDTYRTSTPLLTLIAPERQREIVQSLLTIYERDGFLPDARSGNSNGRTQGGSNAELVLADALARGITGIDYEKALQAMLHDATVPPEDDEAEGRGALLEYNQYGYIPYISYNDDSTYRRIARAGNRTLEYAHCDWAISQVAERLGHNDIAAQYKEQSHRWRNLWREDYVHDGTRGFIMPRDEHGEWLDSLPYGHSLRSPMRFHYTPQVSYEGPWYCAWWDCFMYEASSWEYSLSVPHDIPGLIALCGGPEAFEQRLDTFFDHGYYNVANEPSFLTPCLYDWVGKPQRSEQRILQIIDQHFSDRPDGLPGNDDGGAMSSWLACHMLGIYPLAGTDIWLKHTPLFRMHLNDANARQQEGYNVQRQKAEETNAEDIDAELKGEPLGEVAYTLHGQTRRFRVNIEERSDTLVMHWSIVRNLRTWRGSFTILPQARQHAQRLTYEQPLDRLHMTLDEHTTYLLLSRDAYHSLLSSGTCNFSGTTLHLIERQEGMLHLVDEHEGAQLWVQDDERLPLILRMQDNPIEINWTIRR